MPRALLELRCAMPGVKLTPYPVATEDVDARAWWKTHQGLRLMVMEYDKYLVILAREAVLHLGPRPGHEAAAAARGSQPAGGGEGAEVDPLRARVLRCDGGAGDTLHPAPGPAAQCDP